MKPRCYMSTRPDGVVRLCSWCPDIKQGNEWAESRGYEVTHGICKPCADRIKQDAHSLNVAGRSNY